jgi:hypothetical protein
MRANVNTIILDLRDLLIYLRLTVKLQLHVLLSALIRSIGIMQRKFLSPKQHIIYRLDLYVRE